MAQRLRLALYKGPPAAHERLHRLGHFVTCIALTVRRLVLHGQVRWVRYSHAELVVDGVSYSASLRDEGVRAKVIDFGSGRWDVSDIATGFNPDACVMRALVMIGMKYDRAGALAMAIPPLRQDPAKLYCFEFVAAALGLKNPHTLDPLDLLAATAPH